MSIVDVMATNIGSTGRTGICLDYSESKFMHPLRSSNQQRHSLQANKSLLASSSLKHQVACPIRRNLVLSIHDRG